MMARRKNRFVISYVQDDVNETIIVLKDVTTDIEYLEIVSEKGIALTALRSKPTVGETPDIVNAVE